MYKIIFSNKFEKGLEKCKKRGLNMKLILDVIEILKTDGKLPAIYKQHKLSGKYAGLWEAHILSDWLVVWDQNDEELVMLFTNTGTHSDLF